MREDIKGVAVGDKMTKITYSNDLRQTLDRMLGRFLGSEKIKATTGAKEVKQESVKDSRQARKWDKRKLKWDRKIKQARTHAR